MAAALIPLSLCNSLAAIWRYVSHQNKTIIVHSGHRTIRMPYDDLNDMFRYTNFVFISTTFSLFSDTCMCAAVRVSESDIAREHRLGARAANKMYRCMDINADELIRTQRGGVCVCVCEREAERAALKYTLDGSPKSRSEAMTKWTQLYLFWHLCTHQFIESSVAPEINRIQLIHIFCLSVLVRFHFKIAQHWHTTAGWAKWSQGMKGKRTDNHRVLFDVFQVFRAIHFVRRNHWEYEHWESFVHGVSHDSWSRMNKTINENRCTYVYSCAAM